MSLVTTLILAVNVLIFLCMYKENQAYLWNPSADMMIAAGASYGPLFSAGQWWRIVSSGFVHIGLIHIAFNMCALNSIGSALENTAGVIKLIFVYSIALVVSSLTSIYIHPNQISAGASGALFGLLGAELVTLLGLWKVLPKSQFASALISYCIWIALYFAIGAFVPRIDNCAHAGGLVAGLIAGLCLWPLKSDKKLPNLLNVLGVVVLCVGVWFFYQLTLDKAKAASALLTHGQIVQVNSWLKKDKELFWMPSRLGSPAELIGPACLHATDYESGAKLSDGEIALAPHDARAYCTRALLELKFDHLDSASEYANKALAIDPKDYESLLARSRIELCDDKPKEAINDAHVALSDPKAEHSEVYDVIGCALLMQGKYRESLTNFNKALSVNQEFVAALYHRGLAYRKLKELSQSEAVLSAARENNFAPGYLEERLKKAIDK